jgi:hypothetical protein
MRSPGTEEVGMANGKTTEEVHTNTGLPRELRLELDAVRLARARRNGGRPPPLKALVIEALEALVAQERRR